jgi:hypothetical protein
MRETKAYTRSKHEIPLVEEIKSLFSFYSAIIFRRDGRGSGEVDHQFAVDFACTPSNYVTQ